MSGNVVSLVTNSVQWVSRKLREHEPNILHVMVVAVLEDGRTVTLHGAKSAKPVTMLGGLELAKLDMVERIRYDSRNREGG